MKRIGSAKALFDTDFGSGSVAGFSLRTLSKDMVGQPVVKVRRSVDDVEQDIGLTKDGLDEDALISFIGSGNGFVTTWYDQSGNNNHAVQTTASAQPKIVSDGAVVTDNGKPSLRFNQSWFNIGSTLGTTELFADASEEFGVINVFRTNTGNQGSLIAKAGGATRNNFYTFILNDNIGIRVRGTNVTNTISNVTDKTNILLNDWDGSTFNSKLNDEGVINPSVGVDNKDTSDINIGSRSNGEFLLTGWQSEVIIFDESKFTDWNALFNNLINYYFENFEKPSAFTSGDWEITVISGTESEVEITNYPSDGGLNASVEYRVNGGATQTASVTADKFTVTASVDDTVELRQVNLVGSGAWSDVKTPSYVGVLDLQGFEDADFAVSVRPLSNSYIGQPLFEVRRSSDEAVMDVLGTGNGFDIAALESWVGTGNDGFVTTWYDQSGNNNHAIQATAANQPKIVNNGVVITDNGKPFMNFGELQNMNMSLLTGYHDGFIVNKVIQALEFGLASTGGTDFLYIASDTGTSNNDLEINRLVGDPDYYINNALQNWQYRLDVFNSLSASINSLYFNGATFDQIESISKDNDRLGIGLYSEFITYSTDKSVNRDDVIQNQIDYYNI